MVVYDIYCVMDGLENYYFQTQNQHAYSNAPPCVSEKKDPQQLLSSSTDSIFQSLHEIHYGSSPPIEQSTGIYNSSIIEALLSATKQSRGNKKAKGAIF